MPYIMKEIPTQTESNRKVVYLRNKDMRRLPTTDDLILCPGWQGVEVPVDCNSLMVSTGVVVPYSSPEMVIMKCTRCGMLGTVKKA